MFANPVFLFAMLAGGVPVLIHLIYRRKRTALEFPTLMFLRRVDMKLASRRKLKEIILLALRVLAIVLVALALARPGFTSRSGAGALGASADAVLIVDNSASMGLAASTGTRLEMARARAEAALAGLGPEGRAAILTTVPGEEGSEVAALSGDRERLRQALKRIQPMSGAGVLAGAIARARDLLRQSSSAPNRELYICSDFQANAYRDAEALRKAAAKLPPRTSVFLCPVNASAPENNLSLVSVVTDPRPKVTGRTMTLMAKLQNHSRRELTTTVSAALHEHAPQTAVVTLKPGATREVPLALRLGQEGFSWGEVKIEPDDAAYDNVWPFCVEVRGPVRVLLVSPGEAAIPEEEDAFFLRKALDPTGEGRLSGIRVEYLPQRKMPSDHLEAYDAVILCGCYALPAQAPSALLRYVEAGGGLMIFAGARDAKLAGRHPLKAFFGGRISGARRAAANEEPLRLRAAQPAAPFFDDCRDVEGRVEFKAVRILRALKVQADNGTRVLAEFSGGGPAILVHAMGRGQVMWWALSPHADDSNLPLTPLFLALLHRSVSILSGAKDTSIHRKAGTPLILDLAGRGSGEKEEGEARPASVTIYDPDEKTIEAPLAGGRLVWRRTGRAGVYRMEIPGQHEAGKRAAAVPKGFAITPDPDESVTKYLPADRAGAALGVSNIHAIEPGAGLAAAVAAARQGRELFGVFLLAALLMILGEALLANMTGSRMKMPGLTQESAAPAPANAANAATPSESRPAKGEALRKEAKMPAGVGGDTP